MKMPIPSTGKLVMLIVDDNKRFIERMISMLGDLKNIGYINVANDYYEASRIIDEEKPDVVMLDINLPGKNGLEILKKLKSGDQHDRNTRVLMVTNHAEEYYRKQCSDMGADYFLDKSNDFTKVPEIISRFS